MRWVGRTARTGYPRERSVALDQRRPVPVCIALDLHESPMVTTYLFLGQTLWPASERHSLKTDSDSSRADNDDLVPKGAQMDDGLYHRRQNGQQRLVCRFMDDRRRPCEFTNVRKTYPRHIQ